MWKRKSTPTTSFNSTLNSLLRLASWSPFPRLQLPPFPNRNATAVFIPFPTWDSNCSRSSSPLLPKSQNSSSPTTREIDHFRWDGMRMAFITISFSYKDCFAAWRTTRPPPPHWCPIHQPGNFQPWPSLQRWYSLWSVLWCSPRSCGSALSAAHSVGNRSPPLLGETRDRVWILWVLGYQRCYSKSVWKKAKQHRRLVLQSGCLFYIS